MQLRCGLLIDDCGKAFFTPRNILDDKRNQDTLGEREMDSLNEVLP
jgi:hypothetical protein